MRSPTVWRGARTPDFDMLCNYSLLLNHRDAYMIYDAPHPSLERVTDPRLSYCRFCRSLSFSLPLTLKDKVTRPLIHHLYKVLLLKMLFSPVTSLSRRLHSSISWNLCRLSSPTRTVPALLRPGFTCSKPFHMSPWRQGQQPQGRCEPQRI